MTELMFRLGMWLDAFRIAGDLVAGWIYYGVHAGILSFTTEDRA